MMSFPENIKKGTFANRPLRPDSSNPLYVKRKPKRFNAVVTLSASVILTFLISIMLLYQLPSPLSLQFLALQGDHTPSVNEVNLQQRLHPQSITVNHRIAICIPYVSSALSSQEKYKSKYLPPYLQIFFKTAHGSSSLIDFFLFHTGELDDLSFASFSISEIPSNVKIINLKNVTALARLLSRVHDSPGVLHGSKTITHETELNKKQHKGSTNYESNSEEDKIVQTHLTNNKKDTGRDHIISFLEQILPKYPYLLVEYKPAYGHIFQQYFPSDVYSHWGYSDLDIAWGDMPRWVTKDELEDFDIVTYSYGDQNRIYLRGQFTFHKNNHKVNNLWRKCAYLSELDKRITEHISGKKKIRFESAEGCYSYAVLQYSDIRIKYTVKAFTDHLDPVYNTRDTAYDHGLYVSLGSHADKSVVYKAGNGPNDGAKLLKLSKSWFEDASIVGPLQCEVGEREPIMSLRQILDKNATEEELSQCGMYWIPKEYQSALCIVGNAVDKSFTVFYVDGVLYRQNYKIVSFPMEVQSMAFFHFQEWKRAYSRSSQLITLDQNVKLFPEADRVQGWIILREGVLSLLPPSVRMSFLTARLDTWTRAKIASTSADSLPAKSFCLISSKNRSEGVLTTSCQLYASWKDEKIVRVINSAMDRWPPSSSATAITLALTLQVSSAQVKDRVSAKGLIDIAKVNISIWKHHPCILLIHVSEADEWIKNEINAAFGNETYNNCLVGAIFSETPQVVSRKALLNMVEHASLTRWTIYGIEQERGLTLSLEAPVFAQRMASMYINEPGHVFILPQFAYDDKVSEGHMKHSESNNFGINPVSIMDLLRLKELNTNAISSNLSKFDCLKCKDGTNHKNENIGSQIDQVWWDMTLSEISHPDHEVMFKPMNSLALETFLKMTQGIQQALARLLTAAHWEKLLQFDNNPILMIDQLGPTNGMYTSSLLKEVDEFAGFKCMNVLKLSQLAALGYNVGLLSGAFAISTYDTRSSICNVKSIQNRLGTSRCDGCFMLDDRNFEKNLAREEAVRPVKMALLWHESHI